MTIARNVLVPALVIAVSLGGCAAVRRSAARDTGQLLVAAGFRAEPADTPAELADLQATQPLKLVARSKDGTVVYTYSDPYHCTCLYIGGPDEYSAYQRLVVQERIAEAQREKSERRLPA